MVMNINTAALAEGLGLADALGLDLTMVQEVFAQTGANSRVLETDGEDMQVRDHECYFSSAHAAKDSGIALSLAEQERLDLPLSNATYQQYCRMIEVGKGDLDKSGVAELTFRRTASQTDSTAPTDGASCGRALSLDARGSMHASRHLRPANEDRPATHSRAAAAPPRRDG